MKISPERWIKRIVKRIASQVRPKKIILFGSRAYGRPRPSSDIDILVVLDRPLNRVEGYEIVDKAVGEHLWPLDILVRTTQVMEARLRMGDSLLREITRRGKVLYES